MLAHRVPNCNAGRTQAGGLEGHPEGTRALQEALFLAVVGGEAAHDRQKHLVEQVGEQLPALDGGRRFFCHPICEWHPALLGPKP